MLPAIAVLGAWFASVALAGAQTANVRYVATDGVDAGDCSDAAAPCASLDCALQQASDGDEVRLAASFVPAPFGLALIFWAGRLDKLERGRRGIRLPLGISLFANHSGKITFVIVAGAIALVSISGDNPHRFVPIIQFAAFVFVGICAVVALVIKALRMP